MSKINVYDIVRGKRENDPVQLKIKDRFDFDYEYTDEHIEEEIAELLYEYFNMGYLTNEIFVVIGLDHNNNIVGMYQCGYGEMDQVVTPYRNALTFLLLSGAEKFIISHNHPGWNLDSTPSEADRVSWQQFKIFAFQLHLEAVDSIIISKDNWYSLRIDDYCDYLYEHV